VLGRDVGTIHLVLSLVLCSRWEIQYVRDLRSTKPKHMIMSSIASPDIRRLHHGLCGVIPGEWSKHLYPGQERSCSVVLLLGELLPFTVMNSNYSVIVSLSDCNYKEHGTPSF